MPRIALFLALVGCAGQTSEVDSSADSDDAVPFSGWAVPRGADIAVDGDLEAAWDDALVVSEGEIGAIAVSGDDARRDGDLHLVVSELRLEMVRPAEFGQVLEGECHRSRPIWPWQSKASDNAPALVVPAGARCWSRRADASALSAKLPGG